MSGIGQHPLGQRFDVQHACPDCPLPGTRTPAGLILGPSPTCITCRGTGLCTTDDLARWQKRVLDGVDL